MSENSGQVQLYAIVHDGSEIVNEIIRSAILQRFPLAKFIHSFAELPSPSHPVLQFASGSDFDNAYMLAHPSSSLMNSHHCSSALNQKHYLSEVFRRVATKNPDHYLTQHFPPSVHFDLDYVEFLDEALEQAEAFELEEVFRRNEGKEANQREWWILKPSLLTRGDGIGLFSTRNELENIFQQLYTNDEDTDTECSIVPRKSVTSPVGPRTEEIADADRLIFSNIRKFVAQQYIAHPLLLDSESRKFHVRAHVLARGCLDVYVNREMFALFATEPYCLPGEHTQIAAHLTNTGLRGKTLRPESVRRFWDLPENGSGNWKEAAFQQICKITAAIFEAAVRTFPGAFQTAPNTFEIFGLDFLLDSGGKVWLLEVNSGPAFDFRQEYLDQVIRGLFQSVIDIAVCGFFCPQNIAANEATLRGMVKVLDLNLF
jgi:tubulin---tyrosine ligase